MAEATIRLVFNLKTGKKDIYIDYESESDALPLEHEQDHRKVVEALLGKGILKPEDVGQVKVGRVQPGAADARHAPESAPPKPQAQGQGS